MQGFGRNWKKGLALLLSLIMMLGVLPLSAIAEADEPEAPEAVELSEQPTEAPEIAEEPTASPATARPIPRRSRSPTAAAAARCTPFPARSP